MANWVLIVALSVLAGGCIYDTQSLMGEGRSGEGGAAGAGAAGGNGGRAGTGGNGGNTGGGGIGGTFSPGTRDTCETCTGDIDCADADHRCVEMNYLGNRFPDSETGFCLRTATLLSEDPTPEYDCQAPNVTLLVEGRSLSGGELDTYCSIRQDLTTCFAVLAHQAAWPCAGRGDVACPPGGFCDRIRDGGWQELCTYACQDASECQGPGGEACSKNYCGD